MARVLNVHKRQWEKYNFFISLEKQLIIYNNCIPSKYSIRCDRRRPVVVRGIMSLLYRV